MNAKTYSLHNAYGPDTIVPFDEELGRRRQDEALSQGTNARTNARTHTFPNEFANLPPVILKISE